MRSPAVPRRPELVLTFAVTHPNDDDVMGAAGLITKHRDHPPLRFVLAHATTAEAGQIAPGSPATRETLGRVRRDEEYRPGSESLDRRPDRHDWLDLPDGGLSYLRDESLMERVGASLSRTGGAATI